MLIMQSTFDLFDSEAKDTIELGNGARLKHWKPVLGNASNALLSTMINDIMWQQPIINVFGRSHRIPRLQCWMGDPEAYYRYSGLAMTPVPWHPKLSQLKRIVEQTCGHRFNAVLINYYRDGCDHMGWHSDDEPEMGIAPWVASYNLGESREFALRRKGESKTAMKFPLRHDQLMLMNPVVQHDWQHSVPVRKRAQGARINMTFRAINSRQ